MKFDDSIVEMYAKKKPVEADTHPHGDVLNHAAHLFANHGDIAGLAAFADRIQDHPEFSKSLWSPLLSAYASGAPRSELAAMHREAAEEEPTPYISTGVTDKGALPTNETANGVLYPAVQVPRPENRRYKGIEGGIYDESLPRFHSTPTGDWRRVQGRSNKKASPRQVAEEVFNVGGIGSLIHAVLGTHYWAPHNTKRESPKAYARDGDSPVKYGFLHGVQRFLMDESPIAHPIKIAENLKLIPSDADYAGQRQDAEDKALFKTPPKAAGVFAKGEGAPRERVAMGHALRNLGVPVVGTHGDKLVDAAGAAIRSHYLANPDDPHLAAYSQIAKGFEGTPSFHDITQAGSHLAQVLKNADVHDPFVKHFHKQAAHAMGLGHDDQAEVEAPAKTMEEEEESSGGGPELDIPSHEELGTKPKAAEEPVPEPQDIADDQHWLQNKGLTSARSTSDRVKQLKASGASADAIKAALMAEFGMGKRSANSAMKAAERAEKPKGKKAKKSRLLEVLVKYKKAA